jgi:1,2-dihydroxy-3-keto-5-methylthiopentene dioxygenase
MSQIAVYDVQGNELNERYTAHGRISDKLKELGVLFERWQASQPLNAEADQEEVLAAYRVDVDRLSAEYGFQSVDVVSIGPEHPQKEEMRQKFLAEHTHADFEVRFFVEGSGLFYLHVADRVYLVECVQGDLISVPAGVTHWFDMGESPDFKCIRLFVTPEGWVGNFTGSEIANAFPSYEQFLARMA